MRWLYLLVLMTSGCAYLFPRTQCETWKAEGRMYSSIDACVQCAKTLGGTNIEVISGCAIGIDAGTLLKESPTTPADKNVTN